MKTNIMFMFTHSKFIKHLEKHHVNRIVVSCMMFYC